MNPDRWLWAFSCEPHGVRILTQAFPAAGSKLFRPIWLRDGRAEARLLQRRCRAGLCETVLRCPGVIPVCGPAPPERIAAGNALGGRLEWAMVIGYSGCVSLGLRCCCALPERVRKSSPGSI